MRMSEDSKVVVLLCARLNKDLEPLNEMEWNILRRELERTGTTPKDLLSSETLKELNLKDELRRKIEDLLERSSVEGAVALNELRGWGIETTTIYEENYPSKLKSVLNDLAPPVLFYAGDLNLSEELSVGVVGARNIKEWEWDYTKRMSQMIAEEGFVLISGGAKGTDETAEKSCIEAGGRVVTVRTGTLLGKDQVWIRENILEGKLLVLLTQPPTAKSRMIVKSGKKIVFDLFQRNRLIYGLSKAVFVVTAYYDEGTKGTYYGAVENLRKGWTTIYVREDGEIPSGNRKLLERSSTSSYVKGFTLSNLKEILNQIKSVPVQREKPTGSGEQMTLIENVYMERTLRKRTKKKGPNEQR